MSVKIEVSMFPAKAGGHGAFTELLTDLSLVTVSCSRLQCPKLT